MPLPLATTTVQIIETTSSGDPYEAGSPSLVEAAAPAVIGSPSGRDRAVGGEQAIIDAAASVDSDKVTHTSQLVDNVTGDRWAVVWAMRRPGLGVDHQRVGLRRVDGGASGG